LSRLNLETIILKRIQKMYDIDVRVYKDWTDQEIQAERFRLQALASEASAVIGVLNTELLHRAIALGDTKDGKT
jgi:hypothetical protein